LPGNTGQIGWLKILPVWRGYGNTAKRLTFYKKESCREAGLIVKN
jgi:hypothetical protein